MINVGSESSPPNTGVLIPYKCNDSFQPKFTGYFLMLKVWWLLLMIVNLYDFKFQFVVLKNNFLFSFQQFLNSEFIIKILMFVINTTQGRRLTTINDLDWTEGLTCRMWYNASFDVRRCAAMHTLKHDKA